MVSWSSVSLLALICGLSMIDAFPHKETVHVIQHDTTRRVRRGDRQTDGYPAEMRFDLHMRHGKVPLRLTRHRSEPPKITVLNHNKKSVEFNKGNARQSNFGVYADPFSSAAIIVQCSTSYGDNCYIKGTFYADDQQYRIEPYDRKQPNQSHVIEKIRESDEVDLPEMPRQDSSDEYMDLYRKNYKDGSSSLDEQRAKVRKKRSEHETPQCNFVETGLIVDNTIWEFFVELADDDETQAMEDLEEYYCILFTEIDLRFWGLREDDICIRVYLTEILIQETFNTSWTRFSINSDGYLVQSGLFQCAQDGKNELTTFDESDYTVCVTRQNLLIQDKLDYRVFGYPGLLCLDRTFSAGISEDWHDDTSLLIPHLFAFGFDLENDQDVGCNDSANFIMSKFNYPPTDFRTRKNPWIFSNCSVQAFDAFITFTNTHDSNCLVNNSFTDAEFEAKLDQPYPGSVYDVNYQCEYTYGPASIPCIGPGETSITFIDDICHLGVWCTYEGQCQNRTRVFNGTPCGPGKVCVKNMCMDDVVVVSCSCADPECDDLNAMCNLNTEMCECVPGYHFNADGICVEDVPPGDPCDNTTVCVEFAECDDITDLCTCIEGYFQNSEDECVPGFGLCDECDVDPECTAPYTGCDPETKVCTCIEGYSTDECGVCALDILHDLDEDCTGGDCEDEFAFCHPVTLKCTCLWNTFDDNGSDPGGDCAPKVDNTEPCIQEDACLDGNAFCNGDAICECQPGFMLDNENKCVPAQGPCSGCSSNDDCVDQNSECVDVSGSNICKCKSTHFLNSCGVCTEKIPIDGDCSDHGECADSNAVCTPDNVCKCYVGYFASDGDPPVCLPKIPNEGGCSDGDECLDPHAKCDELSMTCVCREGFRQDMSMGNKCVPKLDLCDSCDADDICKDQNAMCLNNGEGAQCLCMTGFSVDNCGICQDNIPNQGDCSNGVDCEDLNAVCSTDDICVCFGDTFNKDGICVDKIPNEGGCSDGDECLDPHAKCDELSMTCVCREGFRQDMSMGNKCVPKLDLCDSCDADDICKDQNAMCLNNGEGAQCLCMTGFSVDNCGICQDNIPNQGDCSNGVDCEDLNAVCSTDDICVCFGDTFNKDGICVDKIPNEGGCSDGDECLDPHAKCDELSMTCVCREGFRQDMSMGNKCVPKLDLCDSCDADDICKDQNAMCLNNGEGAQCLCMTGFSVDNCGICQDNIPNQGDCSNGVDCEDLNAVCSTDDICVCFGDTFNKDGICVDKISNGDPCTPGVDECSDPNAECNGLCTCSDGFELDGNGDCVPETCDPGDPCDPCDPTELDLCDSCNDDDICKDENAMCNGEAQCLCVTGYSVDNCGICQENIPNQGNCSNGVDCKDSNAVCSTDGICVCFGDTFNKDGICVDKIPNEDPCTIGVDECLDPNAECNSVCTCSDGFELDGNGDCVPETCDPGDPCDPCDPTELDLCDSCNDGDICKDENAMCLNNGEGAHCLCVTGYSVDNCGICQENIPNQGNCSNGVDCEDLNAVCSTDDICVCFGDTFNKDGICVDKIINGDPCTIGVDECSDPNAECNGLCTCSDGFELDGNGDCVPETCDPGDPCDPCDPCDLCDACTIDDECLADNTECSEGECRCIEDHFVDVCGGCEPKIGLGSNCSMDSMCLDEHAVCDPKTNTCLCYGHYYDSNFCNVPGGDCLSKVATGDVCTQPDACKDVHARCSLQSFCVCVDGFYADDSGKCVPKKPLCEECESTEECGGENVVCGEGETDVDICQCEPGYEVGECGTCVDENGSSGSGDDSSGSGSGDDNSGSGSGDDNSGSGSGDDNSGSGSGEESGDGEDID